VQFADAGSDINVVVRGVISTSTATVPQPTVTVSGNAIVGQTLTATVNNLGGTGALTYQWRRDGTNISGATGSTYIVQSADAGLPITVVVTRSGITGSITSAPVAPIIQLAFSTTVQGSITASSPAIRYQVVLAQSGTLVINLTSPGGSTALPNNSADVQWFNASGSRLGGTTNGFSFPYTSDNIVLPAGTYFIEVTGRGGVGQTGLYNIRVDYYTTEAANNTTLANAQVLVSGLTVRGAISASKNIGIFRYNLTEPGRLAVNIIYDNNNSHAVTARLLSATGTPIGSNWSSGSFNITRDLEAGTYYVEITSYHGTGTYNLRSDFTASGRTAIKPNNSLATAQLLTINQTVRGFISHQEPVDNFRYDLTVPGRLAINITYDSNNSHAVTVRLLDVNGTLIASNWSSGSFNVTRDLEAGTYYVEITSYHGTGTYNLRSDFTASGRTAVKPNDNRANAQLLTSGQSVRGFISHQEPIDMFRVELTQARRITVNITYDSNNSHAVTARLLDVNGTLITSNWSSGSFNITRDLGAGIYYVEITSYHGTGTYNLTVTIN
jgi:hypothetical protein